MKNKLFYLLLLSCAIFSCKNNNASKSFNPSQREHGTLTVNGCAITGEEVNLESLSSWVKLSVMVPGDENLDDSQLRRVENKIIQLVSSFGFTGDSKGNPRHIIAPVMDVISVEATSTAPTRYVAKYDVTFYVADIVSGTVFNSLGKKISGIGKSKEEAFIIAIESLSADREFSDFIKKSQERLLDYFVKNGNAILSEAKTMKSQHNYAEAIALLESIPFADSVHYDAARKAIDAIVPEFLESTSDEYLTKMKVALGSAPSDTINVAAMELYQMIPATAGCKAAADQLYENYLAKLSAEQAAKAERKMRELEADNAFRLREAELDAEVHGNKMLLEKYKKDAAYDRLPWLRKLIYLGDKDPFDGYEPTKNI